METPSSHSLFKPRLMFLRRTTSPRAQESNDLDFTPVAGPSFARSQFDVVDNDGNQPIPRMPLNAPSNSYGPNAEFEASSISAISPDTPTARLRVLLTHSSDSSSGKSPLTRPFNAPHSSAGSSSVLSRFTPPPSVLRSSLQDFFSHARYEPGDTPQKSRSRRNGLDISEIATVVGCARERQKGKKKSLSDDEIDKTMSPPSLLPRQQGSLVQLPPIVSSNDEARLRRILASTSVAPSCSTPYSPLKTSQVQDQTSSTLGNSPSGSSASQDGPEVETHEADVTPMQDSFANLNYSEMKRDLRQAMACSRQSLLCRVLILFLYAPWCPQAHG
ncbi:hypothetical protein DFH29DRAFT_313027 [Suillus ampliporus]|nr:hypothetical protein DFH29DRAFT_313027 [Suillus ampliporus]